MPKRILFALSLLLLVACGGRAAVGPAATLPPAPTSVTAALPDDPGAATATAGAAIFLPVLPGGAGATPTATAGGGEAAGKAGGTASATSGAGWKAAGASRPQGARSSGREYQIAAPAVEATTAPATAAPNRIWDLTRFKLPIRSNGSRTSI